MWWGHCGERCGFRELRYTSDAFGSPGRKELQKLPEHSHYPGWPATAPDHSWSREDGITEADFPGHTPVFLATRRIMQRLLFPASLRIAGLWNFIKEILGRQKEKELMKHMSSLATIRQQICLKGHTKKISLVPSACSLPGRKCRTPYLTYALALQSCTSQSQLWRSSIWSCKSTRRNVSSPWMVQIGAHSPKR